VRRFLSTALAATYAAAALIPCAPPTNFSADHVADAEHAAHSHHEAHSSHGAHAAPSPQAVTAFEAPCPCGCNQGAKAERMGGRMGPALLLATQHPLAWAPSFQCPPSPGAAPAAPQRLPDPVPITT